MLGSFAQGQGCSDLAFVPVPGFVIIHLLLNNSETFITTLKPINFRYSKTPHIIAKTLRNIRLKSHNFLSKTVFVKEITVAMNLNDPKSAY